VQRQRKSRLFEAILRIENVMLLEFLNFTFICHHNHHEMKSLSKLQTSPNIGLGQDGFNNMLVLRNKALFTLCVLLGLGEWLFGLHSDFLVYFAAANDYFEGGWFKVYDPIALMPFKYHPLTIWLFVPFGLLPWNIAIACWAALNAFFTYQASVRFQQYFKTAAWVPIVALICVGHAWSWQIKFGNITCLMLWLFSIFALSKSALKIAISAAVLILLKPFWLVLLPIFVLEKQWESLKITLLLVILGSAAICIFGFDSGILAYELWLKTLSDPTNAHNYLKNDNQCFYASLYSIDSIGRIAKIGIWTLVSGVYLAHALWFGRSNQALLALAVLSPMLFVGPLSWIHHQILLVPVLIMMLSYRQFWLVGIATLLFTGTGEVFIGRDLFIAIHQFRVPALGFLIVSLGVFQAAKQG